MKLAPPLALLVITVLFATGCATRPTSQASAPARSRSQQLNAAAHALYQTGAYLTPADARQAAARNAASLALAEGPEDRWTTQTADAERRRSAQENAEWALARAATP